VALDLLLLGPPGAGKGTQAKRISADYGLLEISTGEMLREAMTAESELGRRVKPIYERGELVPDDLVVALIRERLGQGGTNRGFVLDGFPRTIAQAEALDVMLEEMGRELEAVLEFQLGEEEAFRRLLGRAEEQGRTDDTPDVIRRRITVYREQTEPLVAYYLGRGILVGIDADRTVDEVYAQIEDVIQQLEVRERG
jgi:adenylate kinase